MENQQQIIAIKEKIAQAKALEAKYGHLIPEKLRVTLQKMLDANVMKLSAETVTAAKPMGEASTKSVAATTQQPKNLPSAKDKELYEKTWRNILAINQKINALKK